MTEETQQKLRRYEELKLIVKECTTELDMLAPLIIPEIPEGAEIKTANGSFVLQSRSKWIYPEIVKTLETKLKEEQKKAQATGTATEEKGAPYLVYRENKHNET